MASNDTNANNHNDNATATNNARNGVDVIEMNTALHRAAEHFDELMGEAVEEVLDAWRPVFHSEFRIAAVQMLIDRGMTDAAQLVATMDMPTEYYVLDITEQDNEPSPTPPAA